MKDGFFYEPDCVENGKWISGKETLEDTLVMDLRRCWNHRYNLERRWIQQRLLGDAAAIWRFRRQQTELRKRLIRDLQAYRSNREFAPDLHQSLENWYLQNAKKRADVAFIVKWLLTTSWTKDLSVFRNAKSWEHNLQIDSEKLWLT